MTIAPVKIKAYLRSIINTVFLRVHKNQYIVICSLSDVCIFIACNQLITLIQINIHRCHQSTKFFVPA
jgi:hypothetical protein